MAPPVRVYTGRRNLVRQREGSPLVDNAWLPSDPRVKLLSGLLRLGSGVRERSERAKAWASSRASTKMKSS